MWLSWMREHVRQRRRSGQPKQRARGCLAPAGVLALGSPSVRSTGSARGIRDAPRVTPQLGV